MIKKHLFICSLMLIIMLTAKLVVFKNPAGLFKASPIRQFAFQIKKTPVTATSNTLSFANEELPIGDPKIDSKMRKALKAHEYGKLQTHLLHRKAEKWFPVIEPLLEAYGIPEDFKYIPLVESGLQSGTSPKGASGNWQFMPSTARSMGLKVNGDIDERQNMKKSTIAACKYIKSMFSELKSWTLVAAAYNVGDVNLKRQINRQSQDNYFKMKLNKETAAYVYKLICMKEIIEKPRKYGYDKPKRLLAKSDLKTYSEFVDPISSYNSINTLKATQN